MSQPANQPICGGKNAAFFLSGNETNFSLSRVSEWREAFVTYQADRFELEIFPDLATHDEKKEKGFEAK